ncbi:RNB domain-containing ribonuclease [Synechococcus sp. M16CYN]|uniref:RNB domain-containing ribonuclease n=1 Tax=Synechococcus sp. M16CYN TaxID=3103139 RepID=UPI00324E558B
MKFTVADLLDQLSTDVPVEIAVLTKVLKLTNKIEKQSLDLALNALSKLGIVSQDESGGVLQCLDHGLIDARLRCSSKGFCFAIRNDGGEDIYIRDHQLNHAWNGDRAFVRITREGGRRRSPEGSVQCILERSTTSLLAQVERQNDQLIAAPLDDRMLTTIRLPDEAAEYLSAEQPTTVVEVRVSSYPIAQNAAKGFVVRPLPLNGGPTADRDLLLTKVGLHNRPAPPRGLGKAPITKGRIDLTDQPALLLESWMDSNAPGLPAVHVEARDGGCRLWVHSPAVAERIGGINSLDLWLKERMEALCLGETWQPLLQPSLNKVTRFTTTKVSEAVSVRMDVSSEGELTDWEFMLTSVKPVATIGSEQLKALDERKPKTRTIPTALKAIKGQISQLETLRFCAGCLRAHEHIQGLVELDLRPPCLEALGDLRWADPSGLRHRWIDAPNAMDPHSLLQTFIRAADRAWEFHRASLQLPGITTQAGDLDPSVLADVAKSAFALDLPLELDEEGGSPSAQELISVFSASTHRRVLEQQLSHALPTMDFVAVMGVNDQVKYRKDAADDTLFSSGSKSVEKVKPSALAPWCCATMTYAHVVNQQVLVFLLQEGKDRPTVRQKKRLILGRKNCVADLSWGLFTGSQNDKLRSLVSDRLVQRMNNRRRQVLELEKDLLAMVQARAAQPLVGQQAEGRISGVQSYGFFVEIGESRFEGLVHVSSLNDDWYEYRSRQNRLVGRKNKRVYQLGDSVQVRVLKVDVLRNQIDLEVNSFLQIEHDTEQVDAAPLLPVL